MKPFNLKDALDGKPVVTRNGLKVIRIIHLPEAEESTQVLAVLEGGLTKLYYTSGAFFKSQIHNLDLFMAEKIVWVNLYANRVSEDGSTTFEGWSYSSKEKADTGAGGARIACIEVEL